MENTNKTGHTTAASFIITALLGMTGSCILFAAYLAVPAIGIISGLLSPAPIVAVHFRCNRLAAILSLAGATIALASYFGLLTALLYLLQCGIIALIIPEFLFKGFGASSTITWATALNMLLIALTLMVVAFTGGFNVHASALTEIKKSVTQAGILYEQSGIKGEELEAVKKTMAAAADLVSKVYPAIITISYILMTGINLLAAKWIAAKFGKTLIFGNISEYHAPENLIWILIASGFAVLAPSPLVSIPAMNLLAILAVIYFLQGWGVVQTVIARQSMGAMMRIGITILLLVQPYLALLVTILGIFDLWGEFRTQKQQENL